MLQALTGLEIKDLEAIPGLANPSFRARQVYQSLYQTRVRSLDEITTLPVALRNRMGADYSVGLPNVASFFDSVDGTRRYLLELSDGRTVETVLMPEETRNTICISSQVGCPVDCQFCLTAQMGIERNLTAGEIAGQVLLLAADHKLDPRSSQLNVVMMGMGEPLLNLENVLKASRILLDPDGVGMSPRRITVSTSGIIPKIAECGREPNRPKLAISLNASHEEQRQLLMPITRKWHLKDLLEACRSYPLRPWEKLTFEYVLLGGVNDTDADASRVVRLLANLNCKVNLIALNPGPGIPFQQPEAGRVEAFQTIVRRSLPCFIRRPRGLDIYAACGQLKRTTELVNLAV
ncbi:MAG: 23S rRNA (adenine(2503)-C(2))-methyltransferase RlmN [Bryobacteraceae bacterium]|nr:23S rRNA (adenine(2503)-C(2))-methyltransferase RlmN [Bryobacteraceae bacterium]